MEKVLDNGLKTISKLELSQEIGQAHMPRLSAEELPDVMLVADRFHLRQNLLETIQKAINREIPVTIAIPHEKEAVSVSSQVQATDDSKKMLSDVDNFPEFHNKRYQLILQVQKFSKDGCSNHEMARRLGIGRNTVRKYKTDDPNLLNQYRIRQSKLDVFRGFI